jgi:hypothetical protein
VEMEWCTSWWLKTQWQPHYCICHGMPTEVWQYQHGEVSMNDSLDQLQSHCWTLFACKQCCVQDYLWHIVNGSKWWWWWSYVSCCITTVNGGIILERYFGTACTVLAWWVVHHPCQVLCWLRDMHGNQCPQEGQGSFTMGFPE